MAPVFTLGCDFVEIAFQRIPAILYAFKALVSAEKGLTEPIFSYYIKWNENSDFSFLNKATTKQDGNSWVPTVIKNLISKPEFSEGYKTDQEKWSISLKYGTGKGRESWKNMEFKQDRWRRWKVWTECYIDPSVPMNNRRRWRVRRPRKVLLNKLRNYF